MDLITAVPQHRLQPIYDALDNYTPKLALNLCNKALKKQPEALILIALKALALMHLGQDEESYINCNIVLKRGTQDLSILQAICMAYEYKRDNESICNLYESAFKRDTKNEELGNHWFMGLVRLGDFKKVQIAANSLNNTFKSTRYRYWVITSMWIQIVMGLGNENLLLQLVSKSLEKAVEEKAMDNYEQFILYLDVLEKKEEYNLISGILTGPLGTKLIKVDSERDYLIAKNYYKAKDYKNAYIALKKVSTNLPDDWESKYLLVETALKLNESDIEDYLINQNKENPKLRAPLLARLEYLRLLSKNNKIDKKLSHQLIIDYAKSIGTKLTFYPDISRFLIPELIDETIITELYNSLNKTASIESINNLEDVILISNIERISSFISTKTDLEFYKSEVIRLNQLYIHSLKFGELLDEREIQPADSFMILSLFYLIKLYKDSNNDSYLYESLLLIRYAIKKSKWNYRLKFILFPILQILGLIEPTLVLSETLDIKQMQFDTLSYLYTDHLDSFVTSHTSVGSIQLAEQIYRGNQIETPSMIVKAFQYSTLTKIPEFVKFQIRLTNSIQRAIYKVQKDRLDIVRRMSSYDNVKEYISTACETFINGEHIEESAIDDIEKTFLKNLEIISSLKDNRDKSVLPSYDNSSTTIHDLLFGYVHRPRNSYLISIGSIPLLLKSWIDKKDTTKMEGIIKESLKESSNSIEIEENRLMEIILKLNDIYLKNFSKDSNEKIDVANVSTLLKSIIDELELNIKSFELSSNKLPSLYDMNKLQINLEIIAYLIIFTNIFCSRKYITIFRSISSIINIYQNKITELKNEIEKFNITMNLKSISLLYKDPETIINEETNLLKGSIISQFSLIDTTLNRLASSNKHN